MKRRGLLIAAVLLIAGAALAESVSLVRDAAARNWFAMQSAAETELPEGLTEREAEIYRAGYANGHYDALHPAFVPGLYVINKKTKKFHLSNCVNTLTIDTANREHSTLTPEELMERKYKPCGSCHPDNPD